LSRGKQAPRAAPAWSGQRQNRKFGCRQEAAVQPLGRGVRAEHQLSARRWPRAASANVSLWPMVRGRSGSTPLTLIDLDPGHAMP